MTCEQMSVFPVQYQMPVACLVLSPLTVYTPLPHHSGQNMVAVCHAYGDAASAQYTCAVGFAGPQCQLSHTEMCPQHQAASHSDRLQRIEHEVSDRSDIALAEPPETQAAKLHKVRRHKTVPAKALSEHSQTRRRQRAMSDPIFANASIHDDSFFGAALSHDPCEVLSDAVRCSGIDRLVESIESDCGDRRCIVEWMLPALPKISFDVHGCRLVQSLIEASCAELTLVIFKALIPYTEQLYESKHGNFVLQKLIACTPAIDLDPLFIRLKGKVDRVAQHKYGCRIVERLMEILPASDLWEELISTASALSRDRWGHYVLQRLIELSANYRSKLLARLTDEVAALSIDKHGTYVVQRLLQSSALHNEIGHCDVISLKSLQAGEPSLLEIACDRHGSYLVEQLKNHGRAEDIIQTLVGGEHMLKEFTAGCRVGRCYGILEEEGGSYAGETVEQDVQVDNL